MNRQILTIGLTDDVNDIFKKYFALDQMRITTCKDISDAMVQSAKKKSSIISRKTGNRCRTGNAYEKQATAKRRPDRC